MALIILLTGISANRSSVAGAAVDYCSAYCNSNGQLVPEFPCRKNSSAFMRTSPPNTLFCCGNATNKYCCSDSRYSSSLDPKTECNSNEDSDDAHNTINYDWLIIVGVVMTAVLFLVGLIGCLFLCHQQCACKNTIYSENGDIIPQSSSSSSSRQTGETGPNVPSDFDPTSSYAFAPPAYETVAKNPPSYCEIFTISHSNNAILQTHSTSPSCSLGDNYESMSTSIGQHTPSVQSVNQAESRSSNNRRHRSTTHSNNTRNGRPPPPYVDENHPIPNTSGSVDNLDNPLEEQVTFAILRSVSVESSHSPTTVTVSQDQGTSTSA